MLSSIGNNIASVGASLSTPSSLGTETPSGGFGDALKSALQSVDQLQTGADTSISSLLQGAPQADVSNVMVAVEKADVAFQLMMQVRNKIVSAYQDIEKMQF